MLLVMWCVVLVSWCIGVSRLCVSSIVISVVSRIDSFVMIYVVCSCCVWNVWLVFLGICMCGGMVS